MKQGVRMSRVRFHKHGRDKTKRLTKYNTFGNVLNFGGCAIKYEHVSINGYELCGL